MGRAVLAAVVALAGCRQVLGLADLPPVDGPIADGLDPDTHAPDAGACTALTAQCVGSGATLRSCLNLGQPPVDTDCPWGCLEGQAAHCAQLVPSGGALLPGDLAASSLVDEVEVLDGARFQQDGSISGIRGPGLGVINGIGFTSRNGVAIFTFKSLKLHAVTLAGTEPIALVSLGALEIEGALDATGGCQSRNGGPGGGIGGNVQTTGGGLGGGHAGNDDTTTGSGGGGAGYGAAGGQSGQTSQAAAAAGGPQYGTAAIMTLVGGSGGGGGGTNIGGTGGGGGGGVQLVSNASIAIDGPVNAGGCGGRHGSMGGGMTGGGGGGGSGGTLLLEAPVVTMGANGFLAVNGGGGAGGAINGMDGPNATATLTGAQTGTTSCGGGRGGAAGSVAGGQGKDAVTCGGGGGGAVGRIRINTHGTASIPAQQISPRLTDAGTTSTVGTALTQ